jgi:hypothetical protein
VAEPPVFVTISTYHVWAKLYLPSVKELLTKIVTILKYEETATSLAKLKTYVVAHSAV